MLLYICRLTNKLYIVTFESQLHIFTIFGSTFEADRLRNPGNTLVSTHSDKPVQHMCKVDIFSGRNVNNILYNIHVIYCTKTKQSVEIIKFCVK